MTEERAGERDLDRRVRDGAIATITGMGEVTEAAIRTLSSVVQRTMREMSDSGATAATLGVGAVKGSIAAVGDVVGLTALTVPDAIARTADAVSQSAASIGNAAKVAVIGAARGSSKAGVQALEAIASTSRAAVGEASCVGADVTTAAVGAVEGAIEIARQTTTNVEEAAAVAATGAIEAAGEIGEAAAVRVRRAVEGTIRGVRVVARTSVGRDAVEETPLVPPRDDQPPPL